MKCNFILFVVLLAGVPAFAQETGNTKPVLLRGPYLQMATPKSIVIRWRTDVLTKGLVRYGLQLTSLSRSVEDPILCTEHILKLEGLESRKKYYYSIGTASDTFQTGSDNYFETFPESGTNGLYRIAAVGDCGNNSVNQRQVRDQLLHYLNGRYLDAWILLGDNAYPSGRDGEYQSNFFNVYRKTLLPKYPLFPSPGNHDYSDGDPLNEQTAQSTHETPYYHNFSLPVNGESGGVASHSPAFYSFDLGNIHFLSLDSYGLEENKYRMYDTLGPQVEWIKKDLEDNQNRGWIVAYWHHPPYTMGSHNSDEESELVHIRENFIRILERYGVDLILCGHSHDYERSRLMQGHYGFEKDFIPSAHVISTSSGKYDGSSNSCPYIKDSVDHFRGTVYVVSGSAGQLGGRQVSFPHDALSFADADNGGVSILEVEGNRLDLKWICADGVIRDHFTMMKRVNSRSVAHIRKGDHITLTASYVGKYYWSNGKTSVRNITVTPTTNTTYSVSDHMNCLEDRFEVKIDP